MKQPKDKNLMSMTDLLKSNRIFWVKSLPTLKKWVHRDMKRRNLLKTIVVKNDGRGSRYYFSPMNVENYVNAFYRGELDIKSRK